MSSVPNDRLGTRRGHDGRNRGVTNVGSNVYVAVDGGVAGQDASTPAWWSSPDGDDQTTAVDLGTGVTNVGVNSGSFPLAKRAHYGYSQCAPISMSGLLGLVVPVERIAAEQTPSRRVYSNEAGASAAPGAAAGAGARARAAAAGAAGRRAAATLLRLRPATRGLPRLRRLQARGRGQERAADLLQQGVPGGALEGGRPPAGLPGQPVVDESRESTGAALSSANCLSKKISAEGPPRG